MQKILALHLDQINIKLKASVNKYEHLAIGKVIVIGNRYANKYAICQNPLAAFPALALASQFPPGKEKLEKGS